MPRSPAPSGIAREGDPSRPRFILLYGGRELELEPGQYFIGRSTDAEFVLDDPLVSRTHARLLATQEAVVIEDMRSEHGVFVNGKKIRRSVGLSDGDRILVGATELSFCVLPGTTPRRRFSGEQSAPTPAPVLGALPGPGKDTLSTLEADAFEYLGNIADKLIIAGRAKTAERVLKGHLDSVLEAARQGEPVERAVRDAASTCAMRLAEALGEPRWVHFTLELHVIFASPLCAEAASTLERLLPILTETSRPLVAGYQRALIASLHRLGPDESALARRIIAFHVG